MDTFTVGKRLIVGVDIGKRFHQATIIDEAGKIQGSSLRFANTTPGGESLIVKIKTVNPADLPIVFCLEATGHYWLALYSFLTGKGYPVSVVNPYQSDAWRKVHMSSTKTDKEDAYLIADLYRFGAVAETTLPSEDFIALRNFSRFRMAINSQAMDTKRRIITVMDQIFPEFDSFFASLFGKTARVILADYPTPGALEEISLRKLTNLINKISQGHFGKDKAVEIKETAKNSFGITFAMDSFKLELKLLLKQLEFLEGQVGILEKEIVALMAKIPTTVTTIPGFGPIISGAIIAEIGDIGRFKNPGQIVAFAGTNPTVKQSGNFLGTKNHMSKKGSPYLRFALWQAAVISIECNPVLKKYYEKRIAEGKARMTILGAVVRKLINLIFSLSKYHREFDPEYLAK